MDVTVQKSRSDILAVSVDYVGVFADAVLGVAHESDSSADNGNVGILNNFSGAYVNQLCVCNDRVSRLFSLGNCG
jgi:uncharacterized membrane protein